MQADEVLMWDGGIPETPRPPFNYLLTFNAAGLTNEYAEPAIFLRDGKVTEIEPMTELETIEFPEPIGTLEAFVAGGGTDTMPWTYEGRVRTLQNKTLRWKGHFEQCKFLIDSGLMDLEPVMIDGVPVVPRDVLHACVGPKITAGPDDRDFVIIRVKAVGEKDGRPAEATVELFDYYDEETGFTAMEADHRPGRLHRRHHERLRRHPARRQACRDRGSGRALRRRAPPPRLHPHRARRGSGAMRL